MGLLARHLWLLLFAAGCAASPGAPPPASKAVAPTPHDAGAPIAPADAGARPTLRYLPEGAASAWVFPDSGTRRANGERLAAKIVAQLDAEHDRGATGSSFSFALVVDGQVALLGARGVADLAKRRVATADTIYRIASITKTFTATALMTLRDEGKLRLDDAVAEHLPELDVAYPHRDASPIRIGDLVTHSAGLARSGPYAELARPSTEADLALAMRLPLTNDPGVTHAYSNLAFGVLGLLAGRKAGVPYRAFVAQRLLGPLGMTSSGFDLAALPADRLAVGYQHGKDGLIPAPMTANGAGEGAGGLFSTARDMAEWLRLNLAAWPPRDDPDEGPVRRATLREMHTPRLTYGLGAAAAAAGVSRAYARAVGVAWEVSRGCYFERLVGHDGDLDGFHARLRFDPHRGFGFVLLTNSDNADANGIVERLLDTVATEDLLAARRRAPAPELVARVSDILTHLRTDWSSERHAEVFVERFRAQFSHADAVALGARIGKEVGECAYGDAANVTDALDAELVYRCARGTLRVSARGTGSPLRLFGFKVDAGVAPNADQLATARAVVARMQARDDVALARALGSRARLASQSAALLRAGADAGPCQVDGGEVSPWTRSAVFRLSCTRARATLRLVQNGAGVVEVASADAAVRCLR